MQLKLYLIEILHQTTTFMLITMLVPELYLIEILHQTTTRCAVADHFVELYLIEILHQTTTARRRSASNAGCILSKFYIKPQPCVSTDRRKTVVSYRNSTSNHNLCCPPPNVRWVVSYRNSTSNHNSSRRIDNPAKLYLIEILHQTTTFCSMISVP